MAKKGRRGKKAAATPGNGSTATAEKPEAESKPEKVKRDLAAYRKNLASAGNVPVVSVQYLAELIGLKPTQVAPWEKKGMVSPELEEKLQALEKSVRSGATKLQERKRGRKAGVPSKPRATSRKASTSEAGSAAGNGTVGEGGVVAEGASVDVKKLRNDLTALLGGAVSRQYLAQLVGCNQNSILQWEAGKSPSSRFLPKLLEVEKRVAAGAATTFPPLPKRGRGGSKAAEAEGAESQAPGAQKLESIPTSGMPSAATATPMAATPAASSVASAPEASRGTLSGQQLAQNLLDYALRSNNPKPLIEAARVLLSELTVTS